MNATYQNQLILSLKSGCVFLDSQLQAFSLEPSAFSSTLSTACLRLSSLQKREEKGSSLSSIPPFLFISC